MSQERGAAASAEAGAEDLQNVPAGGDDGG